VSLAGSAAFWVGTNDARPVLVATRDLPAGATLRRSDLSVAYVRMDDALLAAAEPADTLDALVGRQLSEPVHADQVLVRAQLSEHAGLAPDQVAITIPARADSAVGGRLRPGDPVQVLVTTVDKSKGEARTRVVLDRASVFDVGRDQSGTSSGADAERVGRGPMSSVTLTVTAEQARQLAEARRGGELDVVLLPPAPMARS
jgi:Flp pilus assembly protein CpaB